jgi:hypothetical protein
MIFAEKGTAVDQSQVSILGEPTYSLVRDIERNGQIIGKTFQINVTLYNSGDLRSDQLTVNLTDEEGFILYRDNVYVDPGKTAVISFTWSTTTIRNQNIIVNFYPTTLDTIWDEYNSGSTSFSVKVRDDSGLPATSTPGFEIITLLSAVAILIFLLKKKR